MPHVKTSDMMFYFQIIYVRASRQIVASYICMCACHQPGIDVTKFNSTVSFSKSASDLLNTAGQLVKYDATCLSIRATVMV